MKNIMVAVLGLSAALAEVSFAGPPSGGGDSAAQLQAFPTGAPFNQSSMMLFAAWNDPTPATPNDGSRNAARAAIAAGEVIFDTATLNTGGGGVTHCTTCHDTPEIGDRSLSALFDIGASHSALYKVKVPILRGLAARAPYFHNGSAADLLQVANFYDQRFQMGLTQQQKSDLVAFLEAL